MNNNDPTSSVLEHWSNPSTQQTKKIENSSPLSVEINNIIEYIKSKQYGFSIIKGISINCLTNINIQFSYEEKGYTTNYIFKELTDIKESDLVGYKLYTQINNNKNPIRIFLYNKDLYELQTSANTLIVEYTYNGNPIELESEYPIFVIKDINSDVICIIMSKADSDDLQSKINNSFMM